MSGHNGLCALLEKHTLNRNVYRTLPAVVGYPVVVTTSIRYCFDDPFHTSGANDPVKKIKIVGQIDVDLTSFRRFNVETMSGVITISYWSISQFSKNLKKKKK